MGLPIGFNIEKTSILGLSLVISLVERIQSEMEYNGDKGTKFIIIFKEEEFN